MGQGVDQVVVAGAGIIALAAVVEVDLDGDLLPGAVPAGMDAVEKLAPDGAPRALPGQRRQPGQDHTVDGALRYRLEKCGRTASGPIGRASMADVNDTRRCWRR